MMNELYRGQRRRRNSGRARELLKGKRLPCYTRARGDAMNPYTEIVENAKKHIKRNIEKGVNPDDTARAVNYSLKQLNRIFTMHTGLTIGEYIRWNKLAKALFELKYTDYAIVDISLKYGYDSQEGFTRAFKDIFSINPGEYRKTKHPVAAKNWRINQLIHQEAHNASDEGLYKRGNVDSWIIMKPNRIWVSGRQNTGKLHPSKFYSLPEDDLTKRVFSLSDTIGEGGAYFPSDDYSGLSFGVEVAEDYPLELLYGFITTRMPQSKYVVFNYPKYPMENHGDAIRSTWDAQMDYDITAQGLAWDMKKKPVFENDNTEMGYTIWFPARDAEK